MECESFDLDDDNNVYIGDVVRLKHLDFTQSDGIQLSGKMGVVSGLFFDGLNIVATVKMMYLNRSLRIASKFLEVLSRKESV